MSAGQQRVLQATQIKQRGAGQRVDQQIQVAALDAVAMPCRTQLARVGHAITRCGLADGVTVLAEFLGWALGLKFKSIDQRCPIKGNGLKPRPRHPQKCQLLRKRQGQRVLRKDLVAVAVHIARELIGVWP